MQDIQGFFNNPSKNLLDWANFSNILNKYYSMLPEWMRTMNENGVHYDEQLKETGKADLYKYVGDWGTFEIGKGTSKSSIINGSKTFKFGSKEQFQKPNPKGVTAGPTVGESYSLFSWTLPKFWGTTPTVDAVSGKYNGHFSATKDGFDIGGDAMIAAATVGDSVSFDIPGTDWKVTIGGSGYAGGLGASGHATLEPKEREFSVGANASLGVGAGFNFGIGKK